VLLQVVADARYISGYFDLVGQPHTRDFAQRGVRLLRRRRIHASANPATLRTRLQRRARRLIARSFAAFAHQLIESRHELVLSKKENAAKDTKETQGANAHAHIPKTTDNLPAKGRDFGLAHTHDSVEAVRASGPAPGRTLHTKSGSTGAEDSTRQKP